MREYKIYLPLKYNDGKRIESTKITGICDPPPSRMRVTFGLILSVTGFIAVALLVGGALLP